MFKKIYIMLFFLSLFCSIFIIKSTYAKYATSADGDASIKIARWKILVNNQDIQKNSDLTSIIKPIFEGNDNIASGVIAPTSEGYFDILIDATNTDVSFKYEISTDNSDSSVVTDLMISGYAINDGTRQSIDNNDNKLNITNNIKFNDTTKTIKLRVYLKWNDDESTGASMDNASDTATTIDSNNLATVKVNIKFIQIPSEIVST